jgi:colanic acid/amylovoran biosynthesis protein
MRQLQRCRIVVTGAYHAAVFALAQGIPAVCLARSPFFVDKFLGLADQFGAGCEVLLLDDADLPKRLASAMERAWASAEQIRPVLLEAAARQIEISRAAYRKFHDLVPQLSPATRASML